LAPSCGCTPQGHVLRFFNFFQNPTFGTRILMINPPAKKVLSQVGKIDLRLPQVEKK